MPIGAEVAPEPNLVPGDGEFANQWHLRNDTYPDADLNIDVVWDEYRGSGVLVAVIDTGIDYLHADLASNYRTDIDYDFRDNDADSYATAADDNHGTAVAGVIAASINGYGAVGVAPEAQIVGYRIGFGADSNIASAPSALAVAPNADIYNNSWGYGGFFYDDFESATFQSSATAVLSAISDGRGGLGSVVVFAAGNARAEGQDVNYHSFQNSQYIISAAAIQSDGSIASFSTPGAAVLVAAPGVGIVTTDRAGAAGYAPGDFVSISGTSFAAPATAGVVALMLEANPNLGYRDVQEILAYTAHNPVASMAGWQVNGAANWNGGGLYVSHDYGYGLVDAHAAVRLAETWTQQATFANRQSVAAAAAPNLAILDNATAVTQIVVGGPGLEIDRVEVRLDLSHTWIGDLTVRLTSPDGTTSVLVNRPGVGASSTYGANQDDIHFTFDSVQFWGESGVGAWTLSISDSVASDVGVLQRWQLRLYGDAASANDTYVYTDEFGRYAAEAGRAALVDAGGIDAVNAAAVTSNVVLDLAPGMGGTIDGVALAIAAGTVIEDAFGGDGDDTVFGNDAANSLYGGRGADRLYGGDGGDMLGGGAGNDILDGGAGADAMNGGAGDDTYMVDNALDIVVEAAGEGTDTVVTSTTRVLSAGQSIERLQLSGGANANLVGNALDQTLTGNDGDNVLVGGGGVDTMQGGLGNDVYSVDSADDVVAEAIGAGTDRVQATVSYALAAGSEIEFLELLGTASLNGAGNEIANQVIGNPGVNTLVGLGGNDVLLGNDGDDRLFGGAATGQINPDSIGNDGVDTLAGGAGNDTMDGGGGADSMFGGAGDDFYVAYSVAANGQGFTIFDTIIEQAGNGIDTVLALHHFNLAADPGQGEIERLFLGSMDGMSGSPLNAVGSNSSNRIQGTAVTNVIYGLDGNDTLLGMGGDDFLYGNGGNDAMNGGLGNDRLAGGAGSDVYIGLGGDDTFAYRGGDGVDFIVDFTGAGLAAGDLVLLQGTGAANFAQLLPLIFDISGGSQIVFNASDVIVFSTVTKAQFDASDFVFA